jgi:Fur family transcriptional regulator, peroxide stress response regulator
MNFSRQRQAILVLMKSGKLDHPSAQAVHDAVRSTLPTISLATVYRNLSLLVKSGELLAIHTNGALHYDHNLHFHQHFQCSLCKTIYDVSTDLTDVINRMQAVLPHHIDEIEFNLSGHCAHCKSQQNK